MLLEQLLQASERTDRGPRTPASSLIYQEYAPGSGFVGIGAEARRCNILPSSGGSCHEREAVHGGVRRETHAADRSRRPDGLRRAVRPPPARALRLSFTFPGERDAAGRCPTGGL